MEGSKSQEKSIMRKVMTKRTKEKTKVKKIFNLRSKKMIQLLHLESQKSKVDEAGKRKDLLQTSLKQKYLQPSKMKRGLFLWQTDLKLIGLKFQLG